MNTDRNVIMAEVLADKLATARVGVVVQNVMQIAPRQVTILVEQKLQRKLFVAVVGYNIGKEDITSSYVDEIEAAVRWRNQKVPLGSILVFVEGEAEKIHSLNDLDVATERSLTNRLLENAENELSQNIPQKRFWTALRKQSATFPLDIVEEYLQAVAQDVTQIDAISQNLWHLGLLSDPSVLNPTLDVADRLSKNRLLLMEMGQLSQNKRKYMSMVINKASKEDANRLRDAFRHLMEFYRRGDKRTLALLDSATVRELLEAGRTVETVIQAETPIIELNDQPGKIEPQEESTNIPPLATERPIRGLELQERVAGMMLSMDEEDEKGLHELGAALIEQLNDQQTSISQITVNHGFDGHSLIPSKQFDELRKIVGQACRNNAWGGQLVTERQEIREAIRFYSPQDFSPYNPDDINQGVAGQCLFSLLRQFDRYLNKDGEATTAPLSGALIRLSETRNILIQHLDLLLSYPIILFGGYPDARLAVEQYLQAYSDLLNVFCANEAVLHSHDEQATKFVSSELLRLDVIHIKTPNENKAILTPLHPLHLWRFREILRFARDQNRPLTESEQKKLAEALPELPHLLHFVVYVSGNDDIRLPQSGTIELLPTYENKTNRYLGSDGLAFLLDLLKRWVDYAPYSKPQIRLALVDVPNLVEAFTIISEFLAGSSGIGATVLVDLYTTRNQNLQGELARFDYDDRDHELGELFQSERLVVRTFAHNDNLDVAAGLKQRPVHVAFLFDQSEYALREAPRAQQLIVSPLVVTYEYDYSENFRRGHIAPSADAQEGLFNHYHQLVKWAANLTPGQQFRLRYEAEDDLSHVNGLLNAKSVRWLAVADRVLTPYRPEGSVPLSEKRFGQREVGVWAGAFSQSTLRVVKLMGQFSLHPDTAMVAELLNRFGHIAADGIFSLPMAGGNPASRSKGEKAFIGTLVAAAWYTKQYPNSLVASLDSNLAKQWLQMRPNSNERGDLVGLRKTESGFIVEPIEVKTRADNSQAYVETDTASGQKYLNGHGIDQLATMLEVLEPIFGNSDSEPLFTPARREALKYQVFRECFRDVHDPEWQRSWFSDLREIFSIPPQQKVECRGLVLHVMLEEIASQPEVEDAARPLRLVKIGTQEIQSLVGLTKPDNESSSATESEKPTPIVQPNTIQPDLGSVGENGGFYPGQNLPLDNKTLTSVKMKDIARPNELDRSEIIDLVRLFLRGCESYRILIERCDPQSAVAGPTVWRVYVRLARGQRLDPLKNLLSDIGREMGKSGLIITAIPNSQDIALDIPRNQRELIDLKTVLGLLPPIHSIEEMPIPIGITPEGEHIIRDLGKMPHLLVGGTTGSGKTVFLHSILCALLGTHRDPKSLRLFLSTSGAEDFVFYDGLPHLEVGKVVVDATEAVTLLQNEIHQIFESRQKILMAARCPNITEYNSKNEEKLAPLVVVVDEFADLTDQFGTNRQARDTFYRTVRQIAQIGRKRGVHLILCTQRPSADLVPTNIRNLMNARVALHVNDAAASRMILDEAGAEQLQMYGDLLFKEQGDLTRAQGYFVSTTMLEAILNPLQK